MTLFRDDLSLAVEAAMETGAGDEPILNLVRRGFCSCTEWVRPRELMRPIGTSDRSYWS